MLRLALVGTGDAASQHARALMTTRAEGALSWTAICGRDPGRIAAFRAKLGVAEDVTSFTSLEDLMDARICDAVVLATPDGLHVEQVERACAAGLHVLVEKPLALTRAAGERALTAAKAADVRVAVGYHLRYHAGHALVASRLVELVGRVQTVFIRWTWPDPATAGWRASGHAAHFWSLAALGTHGFDLAMMFAEAGGVRDGCVGAVRALLQPESGVDRAAEVSLRLGKGTDAEVLAHVSVSIGHRAVSRVLVTGDAGEIEGIGTLGARGDGELSLRLPRGAPSPVAFRPVDPYAEQLRDFALRAPAGFADEPSALANLEILDRIALSPERGSS